MSLRLAILVFGFTLYSHPASSAQQEDIQLCFNGLEVNRAIDGCTRAMAGRDYFKDQWIALHQRRGYLYAKKSSFREAIDDFNSALSFDGDSLSSLEMRGRAYYALGYFQDAINDFNRILGQDPTNQTIKRLAHQAAGKAIDELVREVEEQNKANVLPKVDTSTLEGFLKSGKKTYRRETTELAPEANPLNNSRFEMRWSVATYFLEINPDGRVELQRSAHGRSWISRRGKYRIEGPNLRISWDDGSVAHAKLADKAAQLVIDELQYVLVGG